MSITLSEDFTSLAKDPDQSHFNSDLNKTTRPRAIGDSSSDRKWRGRVLRPARSPSRKHLLVWLLATKQHYLWALPWWAGPSRTTGGRWWSCRFRGNPSARSSVLLTKSPQVRSLPATDIVIAFEDIHCADSNTCIWKHNLAFLFRGVTTFQLSTIKRVFKHCEQ